MNVAINYRLANIVGLNADNGQHGVAIVEALHGIENTEDFLSYCRIYKEGIQYATKAERLDTLATRYKTIQANAKLPHDIAETFSKTLVRKVEVARVFLKNELDSGNDKPFSRLKVAGEPYFTKKEINALSELKLSPSAIIGLAEENTLGKELVKLFMSKFAIKSEHELLTDNQKKVKQLLHGAVR